MRRKLVSRRIARFTEAMIDARRRMLELDGAVKECNKEREAAYQRGWKASGPSAYAEYHALLPPCGESCLCNAHLLAQKQVDAEFMRLGIRPWDCNGETAFAELMAEIDRLAEG